MPKPSPITGQDINPELLQRAKEFRKKMTVEEKILWERLRAGRYHGLHFRRQQIIQSFIVDFYCHALRLVIEIDGPIHLQRQAEDARRDSMIAEMGFKIIRLKNENIHNDIEGVLRKIEEFISTLP